MKGQTVGFMIGILIAMLIGAAVVVPMIFSTANVATTTQTAPINDNVTCANATSVALRGYINSGTFTLRNQTGVLIASGNYTLTTGTYGGQSTIFFKFNSASYYTATGCTANYTYYDPSYNSSATNRALIGLLPVLAAIVLIVFIAAYLKT